MTAKAAPTVAELNAIQAEWMKLDPNAPEAEKRRVEKLMERIPQTYVGGSEKRSVVNHHGGPLNHPMERRAALELCAKVGGRTDVIFDGEWRLVCPHCCGTHPVGCCAQDGHGG